MKDNTMDVSLVSVRELDGGTAINRRALRRLAGNTVSVDMSVRVVPDLSHSMISLVVSCSYIAIIGLIRTRLLVCSAVATFAVDDITAHIHEHDDRGLIDSDLMSMMLGISVGALRGIVAMRTADTPLRNHPLPIIDLSALMRRLHFGS
ncbi:MAG: hypothetical protein K2F79_02110 [Muribaculaceae bacterium]|nr:hypothetical protein [Muribaculaceae bacterium]